MYRMTVKVPYLTVDDVKAMKAQLQDMARLVDIRPVYTEVLATNVGYRLAMDALKSSTTEYVSECENVLLKEDDGTRYWEVTFTVRGD